MGARGGAALRLVRFPREFIINRQFARRVLLAVMVLFNILLIGLMTLPGGASKVDASTKSYPVANAIIEYQVFEELSILPPSDSQVSSKVEAAASNWVAQQTSGTFAYQISGIDNAVQAGDMQDEQFPSASIYKLFLLKPLLDANPYESWLTSSINGASLEHCVHIMLAISDNPCAEGIAAKLGWSNVNSTMNQEGYGQLYNEGQVVAKVSDVTTLLKRLASGNYYGQSASESILTSMSQPKWAEAIRGGCDACSAVYNKTGEISNVKHDAAVIELNGKTYTLTIFSQDASWAQLINLTSVITNSL